MRITGTLPGVPNPARPDILRAVTDPRSTLLGTLAENLDVARLSPSPFYARLLEHLIEDVRDGGPSWDLLAPYANEPATEYFPFRALAGVHLEVLAGERPALAAHFPSTGGDGDADAAWPLVREVLAGQDPELVAEFAHPLQTNETSRCGALIGGFCEVAATAGLPLRVLELGASAGLNLHFDRYRYEQSGAALGPQDSLVVFRDYWEGGSPQLDVDLEVVERRGCDLSPLDPASDADRLALQSYVWPDEAQRLADLRAALDVAREHPVPVDRESADTWVARQLADLPEGVATVVFDSIFWTYVPEITRSRIATALTDAAARATPTAPLAWLRYDEGAADPRVVELRLTQWPGGEERLLATGRHHWHPVHWLG
jgi:hypothetical protein